MRDAAAAQGRPVLEFHVKEGWQPLCEFLGNEVPKSGFPHVNEGAWIEGVHYKMFWQVVMLVVIRWVRAGMVLGALGWGAWLVGRRMRGWGLGGLGGSRRWWEYLMGWQEVAHFQII